LKLVVRLLLIYEIIYLIAYGYLFVFMLLIYEIIWKTQQRFLDINIIMQCQYAKSELLLGI